MPGSYGLTACSSGWYMHLFSFSSECFLWYRWRLYLCSRVRENQQNQQCHTWDNWRHSHYMIMHSLSPKKHAYPTFYCKFISFEFPCLTVKFFKIYNVIENQVLDPFSEWIFICYEKSPRKLRESVHVQV